MAKTTHKRNRAAQDATLINLRALKDRVATLERRVTIHRHTITDLHETIETHRADLVALWLRVGRTK